MVNVMQARKTNWRVHVRAMMQNEPDELQPPDVDSNDRDVAY